MRTLLAVYYVKSNERCRFASVGAYEFVVGKQVEKGGKIILSGTISPPAERKAAAEAAWSAPGISEVVNRIVISYP
jgi:hypothetical protein